MVLDDTMGDTPADDVAAVTPEEGDTTEASTEEAPKEEGEASTDAPAAE